MLHPSMITRNMFPSIRNQRQQDMFIDFEIHTRIGIDSHIIFALPTKYMASAASASQSTRHRIMAKAVAIVAVLALLALLYLGLFPSLEYVFGALLPPFFRSCALVVLALWLWQWVSAVLAHAGISLPLLLEVSPAADESMFGLALVLTGVLAGFITVFNVVSALNLTWIQPSTVVSISLITFLLFVFNPMPVWARPVRARFSSALFRIAWGGFSQPIHFSDILLADVFTSFARVFGDFTHSTCSVIFASEEKLFGEPFCSNSLLVVVAMCMPYLFRLRQCLAEWNTGGSVMSLWNALKYSSVLPPQVISYLLLTGQYPKDHAIYTAWTVFATINSAYSLWWDYRQDWGLLALRSRHKLLRNTLMLQPGHLLHFSRAEIILPKPILSADASSIPLSSTGTSSPNSPTTSSLSHPREPSFPSNQPILYYAAMLFNALARFGWAWRFLLIRMGWHLNPEWSVFTLQLMEVVRRSVWMIFRCEKQWVYAMRRHGADE